MWYFEFYLVLMRDNVFRMSSLVTDTWTKISSLASIRDVGITCLSLPHLFHQKMVMLYLSSFKPMLWSFQKFLPKVLPHKFSKLSIFFSFYILFLVYFFTFFLYLSHCQLFLSSRVSIEGHCCVYKHRVPYGVSALPDHHEQHTFAFRQPHLFQKELHAPLRQVQVLYLKGFCSLKLPHSKISMMCGVTKISLGFLTQWKACSY